jgi:hypothetical protein
VIAARLQGGTISATLRSHKPERLVKLAAAASICLAIVAGQVRAQPVIAPPTQKQALAHQLMEASGGVQQIDGIIRTMLQGIYANMAKSLPPEQARISQAIYGQMTESFVALTPQLISATEQVYARDLTEQELRDQLAWLHSESGQSIRAKTSVLLRDTLAAEMPIIMAAMPAILQKTVDEACRQNNCSDQDRQMVQAALEKAMHPRAS